MKKESVRFIWTVLALVILLFSSAAAQISTDEMEKTLENTDVIPADNMSLALQFGKISDPLPKNTEQPPAWKKGMTRRFNVLNVSSGVSRTCQSQIQYVGTNTVFWVDQDALSMVPSEFDAQAEKFDQTIYPQMHQIFGQERFPGYDNDSRMHILFTGLIGNNYLGFFSSRDEDDPRAFPSSNGMELVCLNSDLLFSRVAQINDTLSHEFQHMIQNAHDWNEESFIDEGFSGLAQYLTVGDASDSLVRSYLENTDISLIHWPMSDSALPWYGSSFLFAKYLYDRMGGDFIRAVVGEPENGLRGIDQVLKGWPGNSEQLTADGLYSEWVTALSLALAGYAGRQYFYKDYQLPHANTGITSLPCDNRELDLDAEQYGIDFFNMRCSQGKYLLRFSGETDTPVLSFQPKEGSFAWWTNAVNNSQTYIKREFDLTAAAGKPVSLEYDLAMNIEKGYDFLYLSVSDDDQKTWKNLHPAHGTDNNDSGFNLGWGYTGKSDWLHETVDLSDYAGKKLWIRFDYVTDTANAYEGALIDSIRLDAIGFLDDAETDAAGWETSGFIRLSNQVPQNYLTVFFADNLGFRQEGVPVVTDAVRNTSEKGTEQDYICDLNQHTGCFLAVSPINRFSFRKAGYKLKIERVE